MRALVLLLAAWVAMPAYANGTRLGFVRASNAAKTAGAKTFSVTPPSGSTWFVAHSCYYNDNSKQDPTSVSLGGQTATNRASAGNSSTVYSAIYTGAVSGTGSQTFAYTMPATGTFFALAWGIDFYDGTPTFGAAAAASAASPGPATTSALTNQVGDLILSSYCTKDNFGSAPNAGVGQTKLDETDDTVSLVYYGLTTETGSGTPDAQSIGFGGSANQPAIASVVVSLGAVFSCPGARQCITLTSVASSSPVDTFNASVSPDIVAGDIEIVPLVTTPGNIALVPSSDGNFSYVGGVGSQSAAVTFWDTSAGAMHADTLQWYDNNSAPFPAQAPVSVVYRVPLNVPMTPVTVTGLCSDNDADALTYTVVDPLPTGLVYSSGVLSGTATVAGTYTITFRCTDVAGNQTDFQ